MFEIKMTGIETLQKNYKDFEKRVKKYIPYGMNAVANDLTKSLQAHIQTEVYDAYEPTSYLRRVENPQYGTPMISETNISFLKETGGEEWIFDYTPKTYNSYYGDSRSYFHDGDSLIKAIQSDENYPWGVHTRRQRKFWDHFYTENITGAQIDLYFTNGINAANKNLDVIADYNVEEGEKDDKIMTW